MLKVGITGQFGFIGAHLNNRIDLLKEEFEIIPFDKEYFNEMSLLEDWAVKCDVIVHLAGMNRNSEQSQIYETNISLIDKLLKAVDGFENPPHILLSSSTQEENDNLYGQSKKECRIILQNWAAAKNSCITGLIIPNVFGPFGKPFYNSVVSTFCYQLCNKMEPTINIDAKLKLIYVNELVDEIIYCVRNAINDPIRNVKHTSEYFVTEILNRLILYREQYIENGAFPELKNKFDIDLFNTFRSYINQVDYFPRKLKKNVDSRGEFVEMIKLHQGGQVSFSTTKPGITRGNHFHTRKIERFLVIKGKALIELRKFNSDEKMQFFLDGNEPSYVDMPVWVTHNIQNIGKDDLYTVFWINEFFDARDPDTYMEVV